MKIIDDLFRSIRRRQPRVLPIPEVQERNNRAVLETDFRFGVFRFIWNSHSGENVCLSPFSIGSTLALLYGGTAGETRRAIAGTLCLEDLQPAELDRRYKDLLDLWQAESRCPAFQLNVAMSLWTGKDFPIKKEFAERAKANYDTEMAELDFAGAPAKSVRIINSWVTQKTQSKIPSIIDAVSPDTRLVLVNAVYFKGLWDWDAVFNKEQTRKEQFYLLNGSQKRHPMMHRSENHPLEYYRSGGFQAVILPYKDTSIEMILFLPDKRSGLDEFLQNLTAGNWVRWMSDFHSTPGEIVLPRFKLKCAYALNDALASLGMGVAFGKQADFSGISPQPIWIDRVQHRTSLEVDEKGTEAVGDHGFDGTGRRYRAACRILDDLRPSLLLRYSRQQDRRDLVCSRCSRSRIVIGGVSTGVGPIIEGCDPDALHSLSGKTACLF
jgi:serpin B